MRIIALIFLLIFLFVAGGGVSQHERWKIEQINIVGNKVVSQDQMLHSMNNLLLGNYFFVYSKMNSYLFPKDEIQAFFMNEFPELATVDIRRVDAHTISIEVSERKQYALWCGETYSYDSSSGRGDLHNCYFVDRNGFLFSLAPTFSSGVYFEIYAPLDYKDKEIPLRSYIKKKEFYVIRDYHELFKTDVAPLLRAIVKPENGMTIILAKSAQNPMLEGVEIRTNMETNATTTISNLLRALTVQFPDGEIPKKKLHYIDMRFGNKIFFGYEN